MNYGLPWAAEVEHTHSERIINLLNMIKVNCTVLPGKNYGDAHLIFTQLNIFSYVIPVESLNSISRVFYVPHSSCDMKYVKFY